LFDASGQRHPQHITYPLLLSAVFAGYPVFPAFDLMAISPMLKKYVGRTRKSHWKKKGSRDDYQHGASNDHYTARKGAIFRIEE
jgi:hypothetical protein